MKKPFIPGILPPDLSVIYTLDFIRLLGEANRSLARLGELPHLIPNTDLLAAPLLRKEAVLSSKIEGTQTTLSELFKYEAQISDTDVKREDAKEVENYVKALHQGMEDVGKIGLTIRTIKNMHKVLLTGVRNEQGVPGEFRDFQNYIAPRGTPIEQATYMPPPPQEVTRLMDEFESYLSQKETIEDPIIQSGLLHYQFEAIHPFGDGNGRIGRLLIPLFFYERSVIKYPLVYISEVLEQNHKTYYELLRGITEEGGWGNWLRFFVEAIKNQSDATHKRGEAIIELYRKYHEWARNEMQTVNATVLVEHIFRHPYTAAPFVSKRLKVAPPTAMRLLEKFADAKILDRSRGVIKRPKFPRPVRLYIFKELIDIINHP